MTQAKTFRVSIGLMAASLVFAQSTSRRLLKLDDIHRFQDVRGAQISPDGKWVAYTLSSVDVEGDKSDSDVWMVSWDGSRQVRLTSSPGGERDFNVPLVGGEQMYEALRSLGVPTQLVIYPGQNHGIARPSYQKDRMERYLAWYAKYLKPPETPAAAAGAGAW